VRAGGDGVFLGVVPPQAVSSANWSPTGRSVVGASRDGIVRIWDATSANRISIFEGSRAPLTMATWSPNGKSIVTAADDGSVRIYMVIFQDIVSQANRLRVGELTPSQLNLALQGQLVPDNAGTPTPTQP
jgi:WD40 repeat protein